MEHVNCACMLPAQLLTTPHVQHAPQQLHMCTISHAHLISSSLAPEDAWHAIVRLLPAPWRPTTSTSSSTTWAPSWAHTPAWAKHMVKCAHGAHGVHAPPPGMPHPPTRHPARPRLPARRPAMPPPPGMPPRHLARRPACPTRPPATRHPASLRVTPQPRLSARRPPPGTPPRRPARHPATPEHRRPWPPGARCSLLGQPGTAPPGTGPCAR
jgi:hypothetical protein